MELMVLQRGSCEPLKAGVHAAAFGLFALMGLYNAAAWLSRRQRHLAVNAIVYSTLTIWERQHIERHVAEVRRCRMARAVREPQAAEERSAQARRFEAIVPAEFAA